MIDFFKTTQNFKRNGCFRGRGLLDKTTLLNSIRKDIWEP